MPLISLEGIERCGKSTQAKELVDYLGGPEKVVHTRMPGATSVGKVLRQLLLNPDMGVASRCEPLLFAADEAQTFHEIIKPALDAEMWVVCDRYVDSMYAYQGYGRKRSRGLIRTICDYAVQDHMPGLTFLFDLKVEKAFARGSDREFGTEKDRIEAEAMEFHERVREGFLEIARKEPERIVVLNADQLAADVTMDMIQAFESWKASKGD